MLLPLGLPYTDEAAAAVRDSLMALQTVVPHVGFENSVFYSPGRTAGGAGLDRPVPGG
ncbi:MAG: hypothetical protein R3E96_02435 [Planctomycetota bacterium]